MGRIAHIDPQRPAPGLIAKAVRALEQGRACIYPTDTVYGIGILAKQGLTPQPLYEIKDRDPDKAIPLLVPGASALSLYGQDVPAYAQRLAARFWPGALTLVVRASGKVPPAFRAKDGTIALRAPDNQVVQELLKNVEAPLATTSANLQGHTPPIQVQDLDPALVEAVELVLDGGMIDNGIPSTIVSCLGEHPSIVREGALTMEDLTPATEAPLRKTTFTYPSADGKSQINAIRWEPADLDYSQVKGVVQIVHGMVEFIDRYDYLARCLVQAGYVVTGEDHIGHGDSVSSPEDWGKMPKGTGARILVKDVDTLRRMTQELVGEDVPYFFYGHSMGSFILRSYLATPESRGLAGALIVGTGNVNPAMSKVGKALNSLIGTFKGVDYRPALINNMSVGGYNKAFEPGETPVDWLSRDGEVCRAYINEPRNTFIFTVGGFDALLSLTAETATQACADKVDKDLPVRFMSGAMDPVGEMGKGVTAAYEAFKKAGVKDLEIKLYPDDRHEVHNELDKDQVIADVVAWLDAHLS